MAKKTNKTNHVLNLLSGADEQDAEVKKATEETEPKIQIVNQNQEDSIAADVQQMLEEELLQEEQTLQAQRKRNRMADGSSGSRCRCLCPCRRADIRVCFRCGAHRCACCVSRRPCGNRRPG